jgi:hypothetical protein
VGAAKFTMKLTIVVIALGAMLVSGCAGDFRPGTSDKIGVQSNDCGTYKITGLDEGENTISDIRWNDDGTISVTTVSDTYTGRGVKATDDGYDLNADLKSPSTGKTVHVLGTLHCR